MNLTQRAFKVCGVTPEEFFRKDLEVKKVEAVGNALFECSDMFHSQHRNCLLGFLERELHKYQCIKVKATHSKLKVELYEPTDSNLREEAYGAELVLEKDLATYNRVYMIEENHVRMRLRTEKL